MWKQLYGAKRSFLPSPKYLIFLTGFRNSHFRGRDGINELCPPLPLLNLTSAVHCRVCKILVPGHVISNLLQAGGPLTTCQRFSGIPVWIKIIISQHHLVAMKLCRTARSIFIFFITVGGWLGKNELGADMDVACRVIILACHLFKKPDLYIHNIGTAYT